MTPEETKRELAELLKDYRAGEVLGTAIVADDPIALKLLAAFTLAPLPAWKKPRKRRPSDPRDLWLWLWTGFAGGPEEPVFLETLARRAAVPAQAAYNRWPSLMSSRLVFPDGTIASDATALVRAFIVRNLPKQTPGRGGK